MLWTLKSTLENLPPWWQRIDDNPNWQDGAFIGLAACYGLIALVAVVQLIRIQKRVPEYGWTTQKVLINSPEICVHFLVKPVAVQSLQSQSVMHGSAVTGQSWHGIRSLACAYVVSSTVCLLWPTSPSPPCKQVQSSCGVV